jgi:hypothetical protein
MFSNPPMVESTLPTMCPMLGFSLYKGYNDAETIEGIINYSLSNFKKYVGR